MKAYSIGLFVGFCHRAFCLRRFDCTGKTFRKQCPYRRCQEHGRISTGKQTEDNRQSENSYIGYAYYCNHRDHDKSGKRCVDGTPNRFLNGFVCNISGFDEFAVNALVGIEFNVLARAVEYNYGVVDGCLLYTSPSPRD